MELPDSGRALEKGEEVAVVESVKAASEVYSPVSGTVTEANAALADQPALVNVSAEEGAWFYRLRLSDPAETASLMDRAAYDAFVKGLD